MPVQVYERQGEEHLAGRYEAGQVVLDGAALIAAYPDFFRVATAEEISSIEGKEGTAQNA
jgi:hypothetical protein